MKVVNLRDKTYWKIGGVCENFYLVESKESLIELIKSEQLDLKSAVTIGNGTNILFDSKGYSGSVIKLSKSFEYIKKCSENIFEIGASSWVPGVVKYLSNIGFGGIEHCIGIPATFGGLIAMNGGSQRKSIKERLVEVKYIDSDGEEKLYKPQDDDFSYRSSPFKNAAKLITSAKIHCKEIKPNQNRPELISILRERRKKFPRKIPNCGSVFLSTNEIFEKVGPPGYVIESLGLKGKKVGDAEISRLHANFIVNNNSANSDDVLKLVEIINSSCFDKYGFQLVAEAIYYPKFGKPVCLSDANLEKIK